MLLHGKRLHLLALAWALAPALHAQLASSTDYALVDIVLDCGGGGTASLNHAAHASLGGVQGGQISSMRFNGGLGILETSDPQPTNAPVIFGVTPDFGPKAGAIPVTISGLNFDKFGVGPSVTVSVNGNGAGAVAVLSNTQLTATLPAGTSGPKPVTVTSSLGSGTKANGFVYTPAVTTTPSSAIGETFVIRNYGEVGNFFRTYVSTVQTSAMTVYGTLLIGPFPIVQLLPTLPYPGPDGISTISIVVPFIPAIEGLTFYFQSLDISQLSPLAGTLTNSSPTTFP